MVRINVLCSRNRTCKGPEVGSWKGAEENHCYNSPESKVGSGRRCDRRYGQVPGQVGPWRLH